MSNNKLITLAQLRSSMEATKSYIDTQDAALGERIDGVVTNLENLEAAGGNYLKGMTINGEALNITNQIAELLIAPGDENGTIKFNGAAVSVKGLADLAFKNEISESDFDDALLASFASKATQADLSALTVRVGNNETKIASMEEAVEAIQNAGYQTAAQCEAIAKAAVAASGHAHFEKVDAVPAAADAEDNVMYLVMNDETGHYDIYAKVGESVELLDDTTVDLSAYSTTEQMTAAIAAAVADKAAAADLNAAVERIAAVEDRFANFYTKDEAEAKFLDETEGQTIAENAASAAVAAATAADADVESAVDGVFGAQS